jgi:predicted nucleic acid-binding protein
LISRICISYDEIFALAGRHNLAVYDAAYLDLAVRRQLPIASLDAELIRAAAQLNITVFRP